MINETPETTGRIVPVDIEREMKKSFLEYSMSVIVSRALPDVRDGLKPVHRRILYTLHENNLTPEKPYRKCADTVGAVLGRYHPHGDSSVYDALVRLAQKFSLRYPLVDGHGNFGSVDGDPPAAYRYTEAKMTKMAVEMLTDINKDTIPYQSNYDDRLKEPVVLPSRFPNLLVNGSIGIAVGMATNIPPHNLREVVGAINELIDNPEATLADIMKHIKGPDFPTGGIVMGRQGLRSAYTTGKRKIILRGVTDFEEIKGRNCIVITEIPYMVNKARLVEHIADLAKDRKIEGIFHVRDESDRKGMRIVVELKKDAKPMIVLNKLFSFTELQSTVGVNMLALVNNEPKVLSLRRMIEEYIKFQFEVITKRTQFDLKKSLERAHLLEGYMVAIDNIDEVVNILKTAENIQAGKDKLIEKYLLSDVQADAIVQMTLGKLTGMERHKIEDELAGLNERIADFEDILANDSRVYAIIKDELNKMADKYGDDRRTRINEDADGEVVFEDLIPVEDFMIAYTDIGYIKRIALDTYKAQKRGGRGVNGMKQREEDFVSEMFVASSHDQILFVTNLGNMFKMKCFEIPEGSKQAKGTNLVNLLNLGEGEKISAMIKIKEFNENQYLCFATKKGVIKRSNLNLFRNVRRNAVKAINIDEDDEVRSVKLTGGNDELMIATRNGKALHIEEDKLRAMGRTARGVRGIRLVGDDEVVSMARIRENTTLLTISDKGYGKRTEISQYPIRARGGQGVFNFKCTAEKGCVCGIKTVNDDEDIITMSSDGIVIRFRASDVRICGRVATGVKLMKVNEGERIVSFTRVEHDDNEETAKLEQAEEEILSEEELAEISSEESQPDEPVEEETEE